MASHPPPPGLAQLLTSTIWLGVPGLPHPMRSRLANRAGTMSSNVVPGRKKRPVFANSRSGPLPSPDREVPSAGYRGLIGSATTPSTTGNGPTPSTTLTPLQSSTDPAVDLIVGLGVPVLDLTVPLVQPASSIAIAAAVTRAEPRRVGRMTPVCQWPTPTLMREPEFRVRPDNGVLAEGPLLDTRSVEYLAERLAAVPGVVAVTLGDEKRLTERAGLDAIQDRLAQPGPDLGSLVSDVRARLELSDGVWAGG